MKRISVLIGVCVVLAITAMAQAPRYFRSDNRKVNIDSFNDSITAMMNEVGIPGLSLAIIDNNKIVYTHIYGYKNLKNKTAVDQHSLFEACSLSKIFLVAAAYEFADRGWLDLDKPLYQYQVNPRLEHDPRYKLITSRMILSHTSGLENWQGQNNRDTLEIIKDPGTEYTYSGEGFHYLAEVMATIAKKPYSAYIPELVLSPLQITGTTLNYTEKDSLGNYTTGHTILGVPMDKWITPQPWPASSVNTNAEDFARLVTAMFNGKLISPKSSAIILDTCKLLEKNATSGYYVTNGFFEIIGDKDTIINFSGNNYGFKADLLYSPVSKKGFVFFANSDLGILPGPMINRLTTRFKADVYFDDPYFKHISTMAGLIKKYRGQGYEEMLREIDRMAGPQMDYGALEELLFQLYWKDKTAAENMARTILKHRDESGCAYAILGAVNMDTHNNYEIAKEYFNKAKSLHYYGMDLDSFIKKCDEKISKK